MGFTDIARMTLFWRLSRDSIGRRGGGDLAYVQPHSLQRFATWKKLVMKLGGCKRKKNAPLVMQVR
jgi:hypothetical protein